MNAKEELIKLLMESYDRGVKDAKQEALTALEKVVAVMVADEREACAKWYEDKGWLLDESDVADAIRARGNT